MKSQGQNWDILQICVLFLLYFLKSFAPKGHLIKVKIDKSSVFFNTQSLFLVTVWDRGSVEGFIVELVSHRNLKMLRDSASGGPVID